MWLSAFLIFLIQSSLSFLLSWILELLHLPTAGLLAPVVAGLAGAQFFSSYKERKSPGALAKWGLSRLSGLVVAVNLLVVICLGAGFLYIIWREQAGSVSALVYHIEELLGFTWTPVVVFVLGISLALVFGVTWMGLRMGIRTAEKQKNA